MIVGDYDYTLMVVLLTCVGLGLLVLLNAIVDDYLCKKFDEKYHYDKY